MDGAPRSNVTHGIVKSSWIRSPYGSINQLILPLYRSLAENIAYGDNTRDVPMLEVIAAARKANIHQFITNLPQVTLFRIDSEL